MSQTQAIRFIGSYMARREWIGILVTLVFALYTGGFVSFMVDAMFFGDEEIPVVMIGMLDWIYLTMFPCFGTIMNKTAFAMWRGDIYTKRLAHFRTMPIPLTAIIKVRVLQSVVLLPVIGSSFLLLQYSLAPALRDTVTLGQWFTAGLIWMCFSFLVNALYTCLELGYSGKRYALVYITVMAVKAILVAILTWQGVHLFNEVLQLAKSDQAMQWIVLFVLLAITATWAGYHLTLRRVRTRSINF